ncbi:MAG: hypothetical protein A2076_17695 [Geobacteraceae bacterium GWC2_53_11]|nr:MAG: hypothetical protein A2076_17695 [Geobacteraceae bacterium GWC2_53_11]
MSNDLWSVILIIGLIGWIFSSIMLMLKAFPQKDVFVAASGIRWGSAGVISFLIWVVGMLNA